jgi:hypothetical protein
MRLLVFAASIVAASAAAQDGGRANPLDPAAKAPPAQFRSAFEGYKPFADHELRDWRKANQKVGSAGGHAGHKPGEATSKPQPGKPSGHGGHK